MSAAFSIRGVTHAHDPGGAPALRDVTLSAEAGETLALLGASGAGKTTLLTLLDGRLRGWLGAAEALGRPLSPDRAPRADERADVGFIFQEFALVDRASVAQNVLNGRLGRLAGFAAILGRFSKSDHAIALQAMRDAGIADLADRRADSLSGGQRQRVAIARCLAQEPRLILADEPVSNLDPARAESILGLITGAARARGATVAFSSHQPELARRFADRVVGMKDGRIVFDRPAAEISPQEVDLLYRDPPPAETGAHGLRLVV